MIICDSTWVVHYCNYYVHSIATPAASVITKSSIVVTINVKTSPIRRTSQRSVHMLLRELGLRITTSSNTITMPPPLEIEYRVEFLSLWVVWHFI